ncbi:MAG: hypothetical protein IJ285_01210 [Clostridia bacterium]|nr:hypothetical protein [Oscillospiraceae bacterium]MBQ7959820.1 hypothetical protein [Clostridia bacterium]
MNFQEAISKMSPQMLAQGLKQLSGSLSPEQLRQAEAAIKAMSKGELNQQLKSLDANALLKELQSNPTLAKQLSQNPELMSKLTSIVKNK